MRTLARILVMAFALSTLAVGSGCIVRTHPHHGHGRRYVKHRHHHDNGRHRGHHKRKHHDRGKHKGHRR